MDREVLYQLKKHDSDPEAYRALSKAISKIDVQLDQNAFTVIWKSETHDHGTEHRVVDISHNQEKETLVIECHSKEGIYEIIPEPSDPPVVRYRHTDDEIRWREKALSLVIISGKLSYQPEEDYSNFFDYVKNEMEL